MKKRPEKLLPKRLKIGYQIYRIKIENGTLTHNCGETNIRTAEMKIHSDQIPREAVNTLIHETLHALYYTQNLRNLEDMGHQKEETIVNALANGLTQVLADNPAFLDWIVNELRKPA